MENKLKKLLLCRNGLSTLSFRLKTPAKIIGVIALALNLTACGFAPLYAGKQNSDGTSLMTNLQHITLAPTRDRLTQQLRLQLYKKINTAQKQQPHYRLSLTTTGTISNLAIESDSRVTRANYLIKAGFELTEITTHQTVIKGRSFASASYNRTASEFANKTAERNAQLRGIKTIADDILLKVAIALDSAHSPAPNPLALTATPQPIE